MTLRRTLPFLLCSTLAAAAQHSSFDCAKASSAREKTICATPALATLDAKVATAYRTELARLSPAAQNNIRADQRDWLHFLDASCPAHSTSRFLAPIADCLQTAYVDRLKQLKPLPHGAAEPAFYLRSHSAVVAAKDLSQADSENPGFGTGSFSWLQIDNPTPAQNAWNSAMEAAVLQSTASDTNKAPKALDTGVDPEGTLELSVRPVAANDHLIVASIESYSYEFGGAHGSTDDRSFSWWLGTGRPLIASDVLRLNEGSKSRLVDLIYTRLKANHDYGSMLSQPAEVKAAINKELLNVSAWQVTREGLSLHFGQYEVGPYVIGMPAVLLSWKELQPVLAPGFQVEDLPALLPGARL